MSIPYEHLQANLSTDSLGQPYSNDSGSTNPAFVPSPLSGLSQKKRRPSKTGMPSVVKRSASTPNVRVQAAADAAAMSLAEKRRNKLGYHRTSVACVDQQPPSEGQSRNGSRMGAGGSSGSSSPSPGLSHSQSFDPIDDFNNYSPATSSNPADFAMPEPKHRKGSVSSMGKKSRLQSHGLSHMHTGPHMPRGYEHDSLPSAYDPHSADGSSAWNSPFIGQSPASAGKPGFEDPSSNFWRLAESPMTPAFSTFQSPPSMTAPESNGAARSAYPVDGSREDVGWPLPSRSMSFGNVESLAQTYNGGSYPYRAPDFKHLPAQNGTSEIYPHPIITTGHPASAETMSAPLSATVDSKNGTNGYGAPPQWSAGYGGSNIAEVPRKPGPGFNGWYGEPGPLAQVEEETVGHHYGEDPAIYYPQAAAQTRG
ncbi:MAG: hypothetical protein M1814_003760 [Vezdaea aestivalis]|nr:MAG: hypothetical protein M1814_003760 [Vezdaea aestivalis]